MTKIIIYFYIIPYFFKMKPKLTFYQHLNSAKIFIESGHNIIELSDFLSNQGADEKTISEIVKLTKPKSKSDKNKMGRALVISGIILLGIGFISCLFFTENETLLNFSLYGLTGLGIIILIIGLAIIFH